MARHKVLISGINTCNIKVLTKKEMDLLFRRLKDGDYSARDIIAEGNLKLVLSILKKFSNRTDNLDDLFQVGCIGLMKAIDNFDLSHNVRFSTYGVPMIIGEIRRYLRDNNSIRVSRSLKDIAYKALKLKEELIVSLGREPTIYEISKHLEVSEFQIVTALEALRDPVSMFEPIYNDGGDTIYLQDQLKDKKNNYETWDISLSLKNAISKLSEREQYIINERFVYGKTQMEVANEIGISQAQISRIEKNAINGVKKLIK